MGVLVGVPIGVRKRESAATRASGVFAGVPRGVTRGVARGVPCLLLLLLCGAGVLVEDAAAAAAAEACGADQVGAGVDDVADGVLAKATRRAEESEVPGARRLRAAEAAAATVTTGPLAAVGITATLAAYAEAATFAPRPRYNT